MAYLMYRSGLVPRCIPVLGLVGGPLVFAWNAAKMFGIYEQISAWAAIAAVPVFARELTLAGWLIAKGFNGNYSPTRDGRDTPPEGGVRRRYHKVRGYRPGSDRHSARARSSSARS